MFFDGNSAFIFAPQALHNTLGGICGVYNGNDTDDLATRPGNTTTDDEEYINSWDVRKKYNYIWRSPSLSELTPYLISLELTHLRSEAFKCQKFLSFEIVVSICLLTCLIIIFVLITND